MLIMLGFKNFKNDQSGQVAVVFALALFPVLALTSAGIEYSKLTKESNAISSALDVAVLAAANNNAISLNDKDEYARMHFFENYSGDLKLKLTPDVTSSRVRLVAQGDLDLSFGNLVGIKDIDITEASAATIKTENTICVLALSEDDDAAISFDQDLKFSATDCSVHSNSISDSAILAMNRFQKPVASSFCAVGGVTGEVEPHSKGECSLVDDPYVNVPLAEIGVCKSEFLLENTSFPDKVSSGSEGEDEANIAARERIISLVPDHYDPSYFSGGILPGGFPIPQEVVIEEFVRRNIDELLPNGGLPSVAQTLAIGQLATLSGHDLQQLLVAYDHYGGDFACLENPVNGICDSFNNPYQFTPAEDVPSQSLVADVFDIAFGFYLDEPEVDLPDIVTNGTVELINGQLFSRNNIDNELIPVSSNLSGGNVVLTPGTYCGGLTVDGISVRFTEGDYIFKDGPLTFLNHSQAKADKVTFGFTGTGATLNVESGSSLDIRAATYGPRQGLAFMQMVNRDAPGNRTKVSEINRISSGGKISMSGTAYFPEQTLMISGEDTHLGANSPAVGLIADKIEFRGNNNARVMIAADHVQAGIPPLQPQVDDGVRLIE